MRGLILALATAVALTFAPAARAQEATSLVADRVFISADDTLTAEGNVEVLNGATRLRATRITFNRATGRLLIEGPMTLVEGDSFVMVAAMADLDPDLTSGVLKSARIVLDRQLQLAANEISRVGGRYTQLSDTVASSCEVCPSNPVPLWEIRARRVVHDQQERQLYFDRAQFRVMGVPVAYIPRLRLPDPTLKRATGFMVPELRTTSALGTGIKLPYFIALGDHADLTLTPYLSTAQTRTLGLRYRQLFATGKLSFEGAYSRDDRLPDTSRGYLYGEGEFAIGAGFTLSFGIETVSDDAYLQDYGLTQKDRLATGVQITRTRRNEFIDARLLQFQSIRAGESNATLPSLVGDLTFHRRFTPGLIGGEGGLRFQTHSHLRTSNDDGIGRDMARASVRLDWRRNWMMANGMIGAGMTEFGADLYAIGQDSAYPSNIGRTTSAVGVELRWPWMRSETGGASQVIEPVAQLVWSQASTGSIPNEDSVLVEFDEGNLFSLNRFPGSDRYERGLRANLGLSWTRFAPSGWSVGATVGRVFRADDFGQFTQGSGLDGTSSDWLTAVQIDTGTGLTLTNRALFDDQFSFSKDELRLAWTTDRLGLATSYIWMEADPAEDRPDSTSEGAIDAAWKISDRWGGSFKGRYDFSAQRATSAGLGLQYRNECITADLSLSRRFTSSTSVKPVTDFGLSVELAGFGSAGGGGPRQQCRR